MTDHPNGEHAVISFGTQRDADTVARPAVELTLRHNFEQAYAIVDRSGAADLLDDVLVKRDPRTGAPIGRPRQVTPLGLLVASVVHLLDDGTCEINAISNTLNQFPADLLARLGMESATPGGIPRHKVDYMWNRIAACCNPSPTRGGKRLRIVNGTPVNEPRRRSVDRKFLRPELTEDQLHILPNRQPCNRGTEVELTEEQLAENRERLHKVSDRLLQATIPDELDTTAWAIDWTDIETWGKTYRNGKWTSADPDAGWGRRRPRGNRISGSPPQRGAPKEEPMGDHAFESGKKEMFYGYNAHFAVAARLDSQDPLPEIAASLRLTAANDMAATAPVLVAMVDAISAADIPIDTVLIDNGYSMRSPENWAVPLSAREVFPIFELDKKKLGRHGVVKGAVMIGGEPHCPMVPDELTNETIPGPQASREEWAAYHERRAKLDQYAFRRAGKMTPDLVQRYHCPGYASRLRCPLVAKSMSLPLSKDIPEIYEPPATPPACCASPTSLILGPDDGLGSRQLHPYGSKTWVQAYEARTSVERYNSSIKLEQRTDRLERRVMGIAKNTLMLTFAAVATNIRHLRNWEELTGRTASSLSINTPAARRSEAA